MALLIEVDKKRTERLGQGGNVLVETRVLASRRSAVCEGPSESLTMSDVAHSLILTHAAHLGVSANIIPPEDFEVAAVTARRGTLTDRKSVV